MTKDTRSEVAVEPVDDERLDPTLVEGTRSLGRFEVDDAFLADDRFETLNDRWEHRESLRAELEATFDAYDRAELVELLVAAGVPAGPVRSIDELVDEDPHAASRETFIETYNQHLETPCRTTRLPFRVADGAIDSLAPPPRQGEHTKAVLEEWVYDEETVERLLENDVLRVHE